MGKTERNDIEKYFEWWLDDCIMYGLVEKWDRECESFTLFPQYKAYRTKYFKTKLPEKELYSVLQNTVYTYDYRIVWNEKAKYVLFNPSDWTEKTNPPVLHYDDTFFHAHEDLSFSGKYVSYVDVKPPALSSRKNSNNTSFYTFPFCQKILLWNYGIYINKVIPIPMKNSGVGMALFTNTFIPKRYFLTDGGTMNRKINFKIQTVDKWYKQRVNFLNRTENMVKSIKEKKTQQENLFDGK